MKRIILPILYITLFSFGIVASEIEKRITQDPEPVKVEDSLDLFRDITDISRQIERRTAPTGGVGNNVVNTTLPVMIQEGQISMLPLDTTPRYRNPLDSIYFRNENGTLQLPVSSTSPLLMSGLSFRDTLFYNPLFLPVIFTGKMLPRDLSLYSEEKKDSEGVLLPRDKSFAPHLDHVDFVQNVRRDYYKKYPDRIKYSVTSFDSISSLGADDKAVRETFNPFKEDIKAETTFSLDAPEIAKVEIGRKYWIRSGEHSFQFIQNRFSDNWHRGGVNNLNFNSIQILRANYKKDKVRFNNTLEWRLSLFNAPDDTVRSYRIGNDLIKYYGDFGVDAFAKGWSYSTNLEAKSQMLNLYPANSGDLRSAFLSPLYITAGVGLKYTYGKPSAKVRHRNFNLQLALDPISVNYRYVWNDSVDVKRFGIPEGKKGLMDIGSNVRAKIKYNITRYIVWDSELTYFTSYEKVIAGFENTLDLALSNAFSTKIYLNARFDDGVPPDPKLKFLQYTHTLTFGLSYKW